MRVAVMILAHKNEWQLEMLVERLSPDFDVYIHADLKWNLSLAAFTKYKNVHFVKRYSVNWGSYNQILATLELFKNASLNNYDYYLLISGQDLPIKSNSFIKNYIKENLSYSFINGEKLPRKGWEDQEGGFKRVSYYWGVHYKRDSIGKFRSKVLGAIRHLQFKYGIRRKLYPIPYYGGWNWVNLSTEAMNYIIRFLEDHPQYLKKFQYTFTGDEIWLQTILFNSSIPIINTNFRFTDWPLHTPHPRILLMKDLERLRQSDDWFARKFDCKIDRDVITEVYNMTK